MRKLHALADYGAMHVRLYEDIARFSKIATTYFITHCPVKLGRNRSQSCTAADCDMSQSTAIRRRLGTCMTDLSLIPEMAWCEAEPRTAGIEWRHGRPPFRSAEVDSGKYHSTIELWCNIRRLCYTTGHEPRSPRSAPPCFSR